jgi:hypothetical protein
MPVKSFVAFEKLTADEMNSLLATKPTRNYVYNSGFDVAQRGTSISLTTGYTLDRWHFLGSASATVSQSTTLLAPNARYSMRVGTNATSQIMYITQAFETADVYNLAGKTVTLSAYIGSSGPTSNFEIGLQYSTSVDNPEDGTWAYAGFPNDVPLTTSMSLTSITVSIPSTAKSLRIVMNNVSNFTSGQYYYIGNVQLEESNFVSPWTRMGATYADELQMCQRYYVRLAPSVLTAIAYGYAFSTTEVRVSIPLSIPMRIDAAWTASIAPLVRGSGSGTYSSMASSTATIAGNTATLRITTTGSTQNNTVILQSAGSGVYELDAEL